MPVIRAVADFTGDSAPSFGLPCLPRCFSGSYSEELLWNEGTS